MEQTVRVLLMPAVALYIYYKLRDKKPTYDPVTVAHYCGMAVGIFLLSRLANAVLRELYSAGMDRESLKFNLLTAAIAVALPWVLWRLQGRVKMSVNAAGEGMRVKRKEHRRLRFALCSVLFLLAAVIWVAGDWYGENIGVSFDALFFTMVKGADDYGAGAVPSVWEVVGPAWKWLAAFALAALALWKGGNIYLTIRRRNGRARTVELFRTGRTAAIIASAVLLVFAVERASQTLGLPEYIRARAGRSTIYEEYYVNPAETEITAESKPKNLLYIYLESMETTYASRDAGGVQPVNYIPHLTELARDNLYFSQTEALGGFHSVSGTGWTMGAMVATTSGVPFAFPIDGNSMNDATGYASGLTCLGDILQEKGYVQAFLCGSDGNYAGRAGYLQEHGGYKIYDLKEAYRTERIPGDYYVWWGFEDEILYEIAKEELLKLEQNDEPFNFTMLTVDTHFADGYICELCTDEYEEKAANVVACADRQVSDFLHWCSQQDFYDDTVIVVTGDHPRMDTSLVDGVEYDDRTIYNCFIHADAEPVLAEHSRVFTAMDIFPTVLRAMGFSIQGDRLGLGTDLFSGTPTLAEEMGYDLFKAELQKKSYYYVPHFA